MVRKSAASGGTRKANILGAKKTKLGAKKIGGSEELDFEAAERKAKEEAERIEKLGYDPEAEEAAAQKTVRSASISDKTKIAAPIPVNPIKSYSPAKHERTKSEMERLGMGMGRLGFGQVGGGKAAAAAPRKMGFGSVGSSKSTQEGMSILCRLPCCSDRCRQLFQTTTRNTPATSSAPKKESHQTNSSAATTSIPPPKPKPSSAFKVSKAPLRSAATLTLAERKTTCRRPTSMATMATWRARRGILSGSLASRPETIWRI